MSNHKMKWRLGLGTIVDAAELDRCFSCDREFVGPAGMLRCSQCQGNRAVRLLAVGHTRELARWLKAS